MSGAGEIVTDSLLCFLKSAKDDYSEDALLQTVYSFYSHENVKNSKEKLANLLHRDISWRHDPDKKKKDLNDVFDFMKELLASKMKVRFVCDSYKGMPPVGLEFLAPLIVNLSEEVAKINDILPKTLDIKSEVSNTADTVRQLRTDVVDIKKKFSSAVAGMEEAANDIMEDDFGILQDIQSVRKSLDAGGEVSGDGDVQRDMSFDEVLIASPAKGERMNQDRFSKKKVSNKVNDPCTGAISKRAN